MPYKRFPAHRQTFLVGRTNGKSIFSQLPVPDFPWTCTIPVYAPCEHHADCRTHFLESQANIRVRQPSGPWKESPETLMIGNTKLSHEVMAFIDTLEIEKKFDLPPDELDEAEKNEKLVATIVGEIVRSRQSVRDSKLAAVENLVQEIPDVIEDLLDEYFTREMVGMIAGCVRRTLKLSRLQAKRQPTVTTSTFLGEASRTYIMGFAQASIALSRAALEQALKESMGHQLSGAFISFQDLLAEAARWNVLDRKHTQIARQLAREADNVLHDRPASESKALEALTYLRELLQHIYSHNGKY
jgi:hypothetical protein